MFVIYNKVSKIFQKNVEKKQRIKIAVVFLTLASFFVAGVLKADDEIAPIVTVFVIPANSTSLVVPIYNLEASDDVAVTGFFVSEDSYQPDPSDGAWIPEAPSTYVFASEGTKTLYAWAKDSANNVSLVSLSASVNISTAVSFDATPPAAPSNLGVL